MKTVNNIITVLTEENINQYAKSIQSEEADKQYNISEYVDFPFTNFANQQTTLIFKGDCHIKGILVSKQDWCPFNLIVDGNLTVDGDIDWSEWGNGSFLFVTGNLYVHNLFMAGCPEVIVQGNLTAANGIVGSQGDNGGNLVVAGSVKARVILNTTYFNMDLAARPEAYVIAEEYNFPFDVDLDESDYVLVAKSVNPACFPEEEGIIDVYEFKDLLRQGKHVLN